MWDEIPAKEFCASVRDGTHDSPKPVESGRFLITSRHIIGGQIDLSNAYLISNDDFDAINKRSKVDRWDVLISMIGTVGEPCLVREEPEFAIKNIGLFKTKGELDGKWLYYYLTSPQAQALIRQNSRGTTQAYVPLGALRDFPVRVPRDREVMRAITNVLGGLDEKIGLNRRTNQTLEAMAQAIFKSWFVDFDPVKAKITAKAEGRDPLRAAMTAVSGKADAELDALPPEQYEQLAATAALFPDEMEDSELGAIPKGWTVCPLPECVDINPSRVLKKGAIAPYLDMANVPTHAARVDNVVPRAFGSGSKFINGDTLLARITPCLENGKTAYVDFLADGEVGWGSTEFIVLRPKNGLPLPFAYFLCRHPEFRAFAISQMAGTSGRQRVPNDCFGAYKVVKPSPLVADAFGLQTTQFMKQIKSLDEASKTLAGLRDVLLPRLLSGELQVQHTEPEAVA